LYIADGGHYLLLQVIQETEAAYLKILESSQTLLTVLKRESVNIQKKRQATS
jgi:Sjoegren syndrome nuclear autoantigen 1